MRAPISVVIPTLNAGQDLPGCLAALVEGLEAGLIRELVVSDGGSTDATLAIAAEAGARVVTGPASCGGQLRRGCAQAKGDWLFVLHADSWLAPGWTGHAEAALATPAAYWGTLRIRAGGPLPRLCAQLINLRSRTMSMPRGMQGLLLPYPLYETHGGYPDQPVSAEIALARRLRRHLRPLGAEVHVSAETCRAGGALRRP